MMSLVTRLTFWRTKERADMLGTTRGNELKVEKTVEGYDEDARLTIDYLCGLETCNGRIGATGS